MLDAGNVGQIFDGAPPGCLLDRIFDVFIFCQIGFDKDHFAPDFLNYSVGFIPFFRVDVQPTVTKLLAAAAMAVALPMPVAAPVTTHTLSGLKFSS